MLCPILAHAEFVGTAVGVIDRDSLRVMHEGTAEPIRLLGVDCPEKRQPFGARAKEYTSELALAQDFTVYGDKRDRYGRQLAEVLVPGGCSLNLNQELINAGLTCWFRKYSKDLRLGEVERQAWEPKRWLWAAPNPAATWAWRKCQEDDAMKPNSASLRKKSFA